jgi:hypothetical protein
MDTLLGVVVGITAGLAPDFIRAGFADAFFSISLLPNNLSLIDVLTDVVFGLLKYAPRLRNPPPARFFITEVLADGFNLVKIFATEPRQPMVFGFPVFGFCPLTRFSNISACFGVAITTVAFFRFFSERASFTFIVCWRGGCLGSAPGIFASAIFPLGG